MQDLHAFVERARADAHKRDPVAVGLVHIRLNFKDKRRKIRAERVYPPFTGLPRKRRRGHPEELLQKRFHAEVGERRPEKDR